MQLVGYPAIYFLPGEIGRAGSRDRSSLLGLLIVQLFFDIRCDFLQL
jgi:hypothetical protein